MKPLDVISRNEFLIPSGAGFLFVAFSMLSDSPYSWILFFGFTFLLLPGLFFYVRNLAPPSNGEDWRSGPQEAPSGQSIRAVFAKGLEQKSLHYDEYMNALNQYDQSVHLFALIRSRTHDADEKTLQQAQGHYSTVQTGLATCANLLGALAALESGQLIRKIQSLNSKPQMTEQELNEMKSLEQKTKRREQLLNEFVDVLHSNDRAIRELVNLQKK